MIACAEMLDRVDRVERWMLGDPGRQKFLCLHLVRASLLVGLDSVITRG
jgi:hypothetical protein